MALACLSCVRDKPNEADAGAGAPPASATAKPVAVEAAAPAISAKPAGPTAYEDKNDLPENAGDARCKEPIPANAKPASVKLELSASPPGIDVVIPSLGVRQRLWPAATNPNECHVSTAKGGSALRFHCSDDASSIDGKIYARKSDVILGRATSSGTGNTKFILPCGTPAKLEPIDCPKECKKDGEQCSCGSSKK